MSCPQKVEKTGPRQWKYGANLKVIREHCDAGSDLFHWQGKALERMGIGLHVTLREMLTLRYYFIHDLRRAKVPEPQDTFFEDPVDEAP